MIAEGRVFPGRVEYGALPWKYAAGTPGILAAIASGQALRLLPDLALTPDRPAWSGTARPSTAPPRNPARRTSLVAFNLAGRDPVSVAGALNRAGVEARAGCHCATLAHHALNLTPPASCRLSFYLCNTLDDVGQAVTAVAATAAGLHRPAAHLSLVPAGQPGGNLNAAEFCDRQIDAQANRARTIQTRLPNAGGSLRARIDHELVDQAHGCRCTTRALLSCSPHAWATTSSTPTGPCSSTSSGSASSRAPRITWKTAYVAGVSGTLQSARPETAAIPDVFAPPLISTGPGGSAVRPKWRVSSSSNSSARSGCEK